MARVCASSSKKRPRPWRFSKPHGVLQNLGKAAFATAQALGPWLHGNFPGLIPGCGAWGCPTRGVTRAGTEPGGLGRFGRCGLPQPSGPRRPNPSFFGLARGGRLWLRGRGAAKAGAEFAAGGSRASRASNSSCANVSALPLSARSYLCFPAAL